MKLRRLLMHLDAIVIKSKDNVATALRDIEAEERVVVGIGKKNRKVLVREAISFGHKFAVSDIKKGEDIFKYGEIMGRATRPIPSGTHAHIQNIESLRGRGDLK